MMPPRTDGNAFTFDVRISVVTAKGADLFCAAFHGLPGPAHQGLFLHQK